MQFLLGGRDLATITRAQLGRKGAQVLQTVSVGPDFFRLAGPRTIEILISQICLFFRSRGTLPGLTFQTAGVPVAVTVGARCRSGGRGMGYTFLVRDPPA